MEDKTPKGGLTEKEVEGLIREGTDYVISKTYEGKVEGQTTFKFDLQIKPPFGAEATTFFDATTKLQAKLKEGKTALAWIAPKFAELLEPYVSIKGKLAGAGFLKELPFLAIINVVMDITEASAGATEKMAGFRKQPEGAGDAGTSPDGIQAGKKHVGIEPNPEAVPKTADKHPAEPEGAGDGKPDNPAPKADVPANAEGSNRGVREGGQGGAE